MGDSDGKGTKTQTIDRNVNGRVTIRRKRCGMVMLIDEILKEVILKCQKYNVKKVVLYGSRAKGTALERSDLDIAVYGIGYSEMLLEEIEEIPTLYQIDLLFADECGNRLLLEDIERYGRKIYEAV